ncbi:MAG: tRNA 2-thiouridine(34) synthase MnmA [Chloroflexota bacterium]|nr:tRNA 2-thiouridine(34) synthase MnmA [Chloroflexota bacterium]MDP6758788.1 tRNA 2-thiouridine(34) synthase MnmA [Chloroflexota bacterium]
MTSESGRRQRVAVAMSGGVDSSVAAAVLAEHGYDVVGLTLNIWPDQSSEPGRRSCCSPRSVDDAGRVCVRLGIPHFVLNFRDLFARTVIDRFADDYFDGLTPNPCIDCNQFVKFGALWEKAEEIGADLLATGHYARTDRNGPNGRWRVLRGLDAGKDQSYVLYVLTQPQLARTLFPLGDFTKAEVRAKAAQLDLSVATKPESMDICFVESDYRSFARDWTGRTGTPGPIVDGDGRPLGQHRGIENFTVGQRRGLGITGGAAVYVSKIDPIANVVTVGPRPDAEVSRFRVDDLNPVSVASFSAEMAATVKVRSRGDETPARIYVDGRGGAEIVTDEPVWGVAAGQAAVLYDGDVLLGGGRIAPPARSPESAATVAARRTNGA